MRNQVFVAARDAVSPDEEIVVPINRWVFAWTPAFYVSLGAIPLFIGSTIYYAWKGWPLIDALISQADILCVPLLGFLIMYLTSPRCIQVGPKGIAVQYMRGMKQMISWADIKTVKKATLWPICCVDITPFLPGSSVISIPLFVRSPEKLHAAVAQHASPINPLRRYLEDEGETEREPLRA